MTDNAEQRSVNERWWRVGWMLGLLLAGAAPAVAGTLDSLAWMAGSWARTENGVREEEHWMAPRANMMLGLNRIASAGKVLGFEFFRIEERAKGVFYLSSPGGAPVTPFKLKELVKRHAVFENSEHAFPQRILYWLDGPGVLRARIEGEVKGKLESMEWRWEPGSLER